MCAALCRLWILGMQFNPLLDDRSHVCTTQIAGRVTCGFPYCSYSLRSLYQVGRPRGRGHRPFVSFDESYRCYAGVCFQSAFQWPVSGPSISSFPRLSSTTYMPIKAATLIHLQRLPPASPPWVVHQSPGPSPLVDEKCCIKRLVYTAIRMLGLNQLSRPSICPAPSSSSSEASCDSARDPDFIAGIIRVEA